jgi:two-component system NtrC family sensor kinase
LTFLVHRMVTKPVKQLVQATRKVANGDLDVSITPRTRDEIGHLAKSFDRMIQDLKKAHQEISSWNVELEKKVEERTWKLQMAKEQLLQSEKMASLGVLASSVAHEINNPLQGILNYIKLMLRIISKNKANPDRLQDFKNYLHLIPASPNRKSARPMSMPSSETAWCCWKIRCGCRTSR